MVPAEHIRLELGAQNLRLEILDRTGLAIGAVVEQRREPAVGRFDHVPRRFFDRVRLGVIEIEALDADFVAQALQIFGFAGGGEHAPAARLHLARRSEPDARRAARDED